MEFLAFEFKLNKRNMCKSERHILLNLIFHLFCFRFAPVVNNLKVVS